MSNTVKAVAFGVIFLLIGLFAKIGITAFSASEKSDEYASSNMVEAVIPTENPSAIDTAEIPGKTEPMVPPTLELKASSVFDLSSGEKIFSLHETDHWPLASVSKLMSSIVTLENMDPEQRVYFSEQAIATEGVAGSFSVGESYSAEDLVYAMMVVSSNDAAIALAETMPEGQFVNLMNQKTAELDMNNTRFSEPTGLSMLNQSTTDDLSLLLKYAWEFHPDLFSVSSRKTAIIRELNSRKNIRLTNINALAPRNDFLGGKTGYTEDANENLLSVFSIKGKPIAIIILGADNRVEEVDKIISFIENDIHAAN
jgi:D-alanyl-D-alanine carboxypeptidase